MNIEYSNNAESNVVTTNSASRRERVPNPTFRKSPRSQRRIVNTKDPEHITLSIKPGNCIFTIFHDPDYLLTCRWVWVMGAMFSSMLLISGLVIIEIINNNKNTCCCAMLCNVAQTTPPELKVCREYNNASKLNPNAFPFMLTFGLSSEVNTVNLSNYSIISGTTVHTSEGDNSIDILKDLRIKNANRVIFAHLNINSIRNKLEMLSGLVGGKIDILVISETKIDNTFPTPQFAIPGFSSPHRLDRSQHGGGLLLYVNERIPSKILPSQSFGDIECLSVEIKIYKKKWLIFGTYNPKKTFITNHLAILSKYIDHYLPLYDNIIILGDFNSEISEDAMGDFCGIYNLKNLVKKPTCYKNVENPSCIDLILTNSQHSFQNTRVIETGLSDIN